jgi:hypothetical protein
MLAKDPSLSFEQIAAVLNKNKDVLVPPGAKSWTAKIVRRAYTS